MNLDYIKYEGVDVVHNLNIFPYPFKDNMFDEICAEQIIEHLDNPEKFIRELWRISKPSSFIHIGTVHFSSPGIWEI